MPKLQGTPEFTPTTDSEGNHKSIGKHIVKRINSSVAHTFYNEFPLGQHGKQLIKAGAVALQFPDLLIIMLLQLVVGHHFPEQCTPNHEFGDGDGIQLAKLLNVRNFMPILGPDAVCSNGSVKSHHSFFLLSRSCV